MIIFVGDRPSRLNDKQDVAFVGTPSFVNLCRWVEKLKIDRYFMVNSHTHSDHVKICRLHDANHLFVALGNNAAKELCKLDIPHFKLPHPSPRNRLLNNPKYIDSELDKCYLWLKEHKCAVYATTLNQKK